MTPDICDVPDIGLMLDWLGTMAYAAEDEDGLDPEALIACFAVQPLQLSAAEIVPWLLPELYELLIHLDGCEADKA